MEKQPLISVIIATYNREKYIRKAVESILNQTYKNTEIVIVDDSTNDKIAKIVQDIKNKYDRIIYIKNSQRLGFSESLNKGIEIAKGEYIARLDDDDFWANSTKTEKQVAFLEENKDYVMVGGGAVGIDEEGKEIYKVLPPERDRDIRRVMLFDCVFPHGAVIFRKSAWKLAGGYDENLKFAEDWDLWLRMGKFGKFYNFQEIFLSYLIREDSKKKQIRRENAKIHLKLKKKYRKYYPNFSKAYLLGLGIYVASLFPHRKWFSKMLIIPKIKNLFFGRNIYKG